MSSLYLSLIDPLVVGFDTVLTLFLSSSSSIIGENIEREGC
jgi:hypothetical protein